MNSGLPVGHEGEIARRRSANYKPNIWKHEFIQSLKNGYNDEKYKRTAEKLKEDVKEMFAEQSEQSAKLELVNNIKKLGLAYLYEDEIEKALHNIAFSTSTSAFGDPVVLDDLYAVALRFRLFRQHGYEVSQELFNNFIDEKGIFVKKKCMNTDGLLELYEASSLAIEGENILDEAKAFAIESLRTIEPTCERVAHTMELSSHKRVPWFNVKWCINMYETQKNKNTNLLKLAKLNFNLVQGDLQEDLREISWWWGDLGLVENMSFARDRLVESFLCTVGLVFEPHHKMFRKWLTKVIVLILIIDDVYDVYGSLDELKQFTKAIESWDFDEVRQLPNCMKICFQALLQTINATANEIQLQNGWDHILPQLKKAWTDFCKALLVEAEWDAEGRTPSLEEYLSHARVSSSGALICIHSLFAVTREADSAEIDVFRCKNQTRDLVCNLSLLIRLYNDLGTSKAERERGDAPSSILCHQHATGVTEEEAEEHIKGLIERSWKRMNKHWFSKVSPSIQPFVDVTMNVVRVARSLYQYEDGFGIQDRETRRRIMSLLIEPFDLD